MTRKKRTSEPEEISVTVDGKPYKGSYTVDPGGVVEVTYRMDRKRTHADGPANMIARMVLRELVEAWDPNRE